MTGYLDLLTSIHDILTSVIVLPNGNHTFASKEETLVPRDSIKLAHVLFVLDLNSTLISLAHLLRELKCFDFFTDKLCLIQNPTLKMLIEAGEV